MEPRLSRGIVSSAADGGGESGFLSECERKSLGALKQHLVCILTRSFWLPCGSLMVVEMRSRREAGLEVIPVVRQVTAVAGTKLGVVGVIARHQICGIFCRPDLSMDVKLSRS